MMKSEFERLVDVTVTEEQYMDIETVYMYYPGIENKEQVARLWLIGGTPLINDMLDRAIKMKNLEEEISFRKQQVDALKHS
jgi:hypothetical protein